MLTKKENLLTRPWVVSRYQSHREKVQSAGPAIDFKTPKTRPHVVLKHKKKQKELERKKEIEKENVRLLQKLTVIMNTLRLDNYWKEPRPNFLNRELIYKPKTPSRKSSGTNSERESPEYTVPANLRGSAKRCSACNKAVKVVRPKSNQISPEKRIPWATPKNNWNRTLDFEPMAHTCCRYCC